MKETGFFTMTRLTPRSGKVTNFTAKRNIENMEKKGLIKKLIPPLPEATTVTAVIFTSLIDSINNRNPHIFDRVSPLIENHWGNVPPSLFLTLAVFELFNKFGHIETKKASQLALYAAVSINVYFEALVENNPEFVGDALAGTAGALISYGLLNLPRHFKKPS